MVALISLITVFLTPVQGRVEVCVCVYVLLI